MGIALSLPLGLTPLYHGHVMAMSLLGGIVSLERAIALGGRRYLLAPSLLLLGGLLTIVTSLVSVSAILSTLGSLLFFYMFFRIVRSTKAVYSYLMLMGSASLLLSSIILLLFSSPPYLLLPLWITFISLIIVGERMELSRIIKLPNYVNYLITILSLALFLHSILLYITQSYRFPFGIILVALSVLLLKYDVSKIGIRESGLRRFMGINILLAYVWLFASGLSWVILPPYFSGFYYDLLVHSFFLGFVLSMIIAHAPIIAPIVFKRGKPVYSRRLYLPTIILHTSLILRFLGDAMGSFAVREVGGLGNVLAIALLMLNILLTIIR